MYIEFNGQPRDGLVARTYAGILGTLAFLTAVAHGALHGGDAMSIFWIAWCCLLAFSAVGYLVGWVAERTVEESVNGTISKELAARQAARRNETATAGTPGE